MKFTKPFSGVVKGDVYATQFKKGQTCPAELEAAAIDADAVGGKSVGKAEPDTDDDSDPAGDAATGASEAAAAS